MMLHHLIRSFTPFSNCFFYCLFLFLYFFLFRILADLFFSLLEILKIGFTHFCIHITIIIYGPESFQRFIEMFFCFCTSFYFYLSSSRGGYLTKKFFQSSFFFIYSSFSGLSCEIGYEEIWILRKDRPQQLLSFFLYLFYKTGFLLLVESGVSCGLLFIPLKILSHVLGVYS